MRPPHQPDRRPASTAGDRRQGGQSARPEHPLDRGRRDDARDGKLRESKADAAERWERGHVDPGKPVRNDPMTDARRKAFAQFEF